MGSSFSGKGVDGRIFALLALYVLTKLGKGSSGPLYHLPTDCGMLIR